MRNIRYQMAVGHGFWLGSAVHTFLHGQWGWLLMATGAVINILALVREHFWMKREMQAMEVEIALEVMELKKALD